MSGMFAPLGIITVIDLVSRQGSKTHCRLTAYMQAKVTSREDGIALLATINGMVWVCTGLLQPMLPNFGGDIKRGFEESGTDERIQIARQEAKMAQGSGLKGGRSVHGHC